jgi:hypothetical protein
MHHSRQMYGSLSQRLFIFTSPRQPDHGKVIQRPSFTLGPGNLVQFS